MPRYHFNLRTEEGLESDETGVEFVGLDDAYLEAYATIPALFAELIREGRDPARCRFEITDDAGRHLLDIPFAERLSARRPGQDLVRPKTDSARGTSALLDRLDRVVRAMHAESAQAYAHVVRSRETLVRLQEGEARRAALYERVMRRPSEPGS